MRLFGSVEGILYGTDAAVWLWPPFDLVLLPAIMPDVHAAQIFEGGIRAGQIFRGGTENGQVFAGGMMVGQVEN